MREILFKAKRIDNGEWVEGYFVKGKETPSVIFTNIDSCIAECFEFEEVDESTICQYTGLTDCNGNKIWEGDIVRLTRNEGYNARKGKKLEVYFNEFLCHFALSLKDSTSYPKNGSFDYLTLSGKKAKSMEVIGNIFDNAELLGGGEE